MKKKFLILTFALMLLLCACAPTAGHTDPTPKETEENTMPEPTLHPDREKCSVPTRAVAGFLTYKVIDGRELKLFFQPPTTQVYEKAPVIFMIPGGGWTDCDIGGAYAIYNSEVKDIYSSGFATVTIEYRTTYDKISMEKLISDCMDAARYLSHYSDVLGIDMQNVITTGHSAGGHLSLMLAYAPHELFDADKYWSDAEDFTVRGSFVLSPPTILYADNGPYSGFYSTGNWNYDLNLWPHKDYQHTASPIEYVTEGGVPCHILMGTHDEIVSAQCVSLFKEACDAGGVDCEIVWFEGVNHGFCYEDGTQHPDYNTERAKILEFAQECLNNA